MSDSFIVEHEENKKRRSLPVARSLISFAASRTAIRAEMAAAAAGRDIKTIRVDEEGVEGNIG